MKKRILLLFSIIPILGFSQTEEERREIASHSNQVANEKLAAELKAEDEQRKIRLANYFAANPDINKIVYDDERGKKEIMDVLPNGELIYAQTDNAGAAITARANHLYSGGSLGLNIQGQGMTAGVWDGGNVSDLHQEFMVNGTSKISLMDGFTYDDHATHVAGTIAAIGVNANARGVAFNSVVKSYDWNSDLTEMLIEASSGLLMSNHSYGLGSLNSIWFYGAYDDRAKQLDNICYNNPYYLPVFSAGNSRNNSGPPASTQMANKFGYDLIYGHANAKNVMTVAAVGQVDNYVDANSVTMSSFSSYGPSDDGRIKPDISMKGVQVYSTLSSGSNGYGYMSGTSMSSPGVTGVVTLLQQYHNSLYATFMKSATVKGLILHTADEAGSNIGPDYEFGWGLINAQRAATVIRDKNLPANRSIIEENVLQNGQTFTKTIMASSSNPLKVSISWTDPDYPTANSGTTDPTTKYLVNDLDISVSSSTGTIFYPWKLQGMSNYFNPASNNSTNDVDNFERVDIPIPSAGIYTITVTHKGILSGGNQPFTLIASGSAMSTLSTENENLIKNSEIFIYPNPVKDILFLNKKIDAKAQIFDGSGKLLHLQSVKNGKLDVKHLTSGHYILVIKDSKENNLSLKFIKK